MYWGVGYTLPFSRIKYDFFEGLKVSYILKKKKSDISGILGLSWGDGREDQEGRDICILRAELQCCIAETSMTL